MMYFFPPARRHKQWYHFNTENPLGENGQSEIEKEQSPVEEIRRNWM